MIWITNPAFASWIRYDDTDREGRINSDGVHRRRRQDPSDLHPNPTICPACEDTRSNILADSCPVCGLERKTKRGGWTMYYTEMWSSLCPVCNMHDKKTVMIETNPEQTEEKEFVCPGVNLNPGPNQRVDRIYCGNCGVRFEIPK